MHEIVDLLDPIALLRLASRFEKQVFSTGLQHARRDLALKGFSSVAESYVDLYQLSVNLEGLFSGNGLRVELLSQARDDGAQNLKNL